LGEIALKRRGPLRKLLETLVGLCSKVAITRLLRCKRLASSSDSVSVTAANIAFNKKNNFTSQKLLETSEWIQPMMMFYEET